MESRHPPAPCSATHAQSHSSSHSSPAETDYECDYNEKDTYPRKDSTRTDCASKSTYGHVHDSVISPFSPKTSAPPSLSSSISSNVGRKHHSVSEIQETHDRESRQSHRVSYPPRAHLEDPEKANSYDLPYEHRSQNRASVPNAVVYDKSEYHEKGPEDKTWQLLFYLSAPAALLSIAITFWTIIAILISLALYPLRFCSNRPPLSTQLTTFLAPALNLQLHLVYSFDASESYSVPMLVIIHLFSPIIAFGVAIASWTAAGFWFFSSILGDPGGHDGGRHNDGKDCILGVRNYWERWLSRGLK
ncbi:hypothetical protein BU25DRAFT_163034 [Macroventuria anomochaeta]|uniref:Uncharacterized protein n=1 Tax=Macroventuria anomochaeta TaxID=301207 RepID=A0ACB6RQL6_9PLEO|nr:uncharacterized protein BU25DRAFT_163034 [Macroventuria anomochaeta]KAF2624191.1 hypothetical protein BU25DRAFT_163034 [Macroventuria anomochaeta]